MDVRHGASTGTTWRRTGIFVLAAGLILAGCSSNSTPPAGPASSVTVAGPPTSVAAPPTSGQVAAGPTHVSVGQQFDVVSPRSGDQALVTFVAIEPNPVCTTRYGQPDAPKGHYVAVEMDVQTAATLDKQEFGYPTGYDFTETKPDGYTTSNLYAQDTRCIENRDKIGVMNRASKYRGWVLLDVTNLGSTLTFQPHFMASEPGAPSWSIDIHANSAAAPTPTVASTETPRLECGPGGGCVTITDPTHTPAPPGNPDQYN